MKNNLYVSKLCKSYASPSGPLKVLKGVGFSVEAGKVAAITGPSGSGKSTLLHIIGSLDKADSGTVRLNDTDILALAGRALYEFRSRRIGFVFQDHHLLPQLTALENVILPSLLTDVSEGKKRARGLLKLLGLEKRSAHFPSELSGGERQRVAVARALVNSPGLLLCDEPTGNLDEEASLKLGRLFLSIARGQGVPVVVVTHNVKLAALFDMNFELKAGRLVSAGKR